MKPFDEWVMQPITTQADEPDEELPTWALDNEDGTFICECCACGRRCKVDYMDREEIIELGEHYRFVGGCSERCIP